MPPPPRPTTRSRTTGTTGTKKKTPVRGGDRGGEESRRRKSSEEEARASKILCDDAYDAPLQIASLVDKHRISEADMKRLCGVRRRLRDGEDDFPLALSPSALETLRDVLRDYGGGKRQGLTMMKLYAFKIVVGRFPLTTEMPRLFDRATLDSIRYQSVPVVEGMFYNPYSPYTAPVQIGDPRIRTLIRSEEGGEPALNEITRRNDCIYLWFRPAELDAPASLHMFCVDDDKPGRLPPEDRFRGVMDDVDAVWKDFHARRPETKRMRFLRDRATEVTRRDLSSLLGAVPPSFDRARRT